MSPVARPNDKNRRDTGELVDTVYQLAGRPKTKLRSTPALLLRALAVTNPTVRELLELQCEFQEPFIVDSTKIATKLGVHATPLDQALADTVATYRTNPSPERGRIGVVGLLRPCLLPAATSSLTEPRSQLRMMQAPAVGPHPAAPAAAQCHGMNPG